MVLSQVLRGALERDDELARRQIERRDLAVDLEDDRLIAIRYELADLALCAGEVDSDPRARFAPGLVLHIQPMKAEL